MADKCPAGAPLWMVTFADLMALLLTLFVLLLTFSELNVIKYKAIAGALSEAFGVSRQDQLSGVIELDGSIRRQAAANVDPSRMPTPSVTIDLPDATDEEVEAEAAARREERLEELQGALQDLIDDKIAGSGIEVERVGDEIVLRFPSEIAFPSGSNQLNQQFGEILGELVPVLEKTEGNILVSGHTDDIPLSAGARFKSNWELSSARATAVVHELIEAGQIDSTRITIQGFGDSRPLETNDTVEGRAKNRRVEISIIAPPAGGGEGATGP
ncbi:MAG: OmpA family protein [Magnetovibrionaceae bacterium]